MKASQARAPRVEQVDKTYGTSANVNKNPFICWSRSHSQWKFLFAPNALFFIRKTIGALVGKEPSCTPRWSGKEIAEASIKRMQKGDEKLLV